MSAQLSRENEAVQRILDAELAQRPPPRVLEAGCGSTTRLRFPAGARLTGIDISERQLAANRVLDEKIVGDVQSFSWSEPRFDVIVSWDVLEHLADPSAALRNLSSALVPCGLIVLALPNLLSIKGAVTRLTPWQAHVWFYRYVMGDRRGPAQWDQFPTFLRLAIAPPRLIRYASTLGLRPLFRLEYEGPVQRDLRRRYRFADWAFRLAGLSGRALTLGRWDPRHSDCLMVLRKEPR